MSNEQPFQSIVILCCNQLAITQGCLHSLAVSTAIPYQLILVDNGSTDGTAEWLDQYCRQPVQARTSASIIRNAENRGFAAGVNQALQQATGSHVVLLNNDTVLTHGWLEGLLRVTQDSNCQPIGMVGPVSNQVPTPQCVAVEYRDDLSDLSAFAQSRYVQFQGQTLEVERVSGFCVLIPREVLSQVGALDERFGIGFFEDDDLGHRIRQAGFRLFIALDTFVHHWGSQTFKGLGINAPLLLADNLEKFRDKWGDALASRYRPPASSTPATVSLCMIVRNEEANLAACLERIKHLVHEMVIVDTGSSDRTKDIALKHGAKVVDFPWIDDFAAARNVALDHATSDYIFWLDADDRIDVVNQRKLQDLFARLDTSNLVGFGMKCVCLGSGDSAATVVDHVRLFSRHPNIRWQFRVHEQILPALRQQGGTVRFEDVQIHHVGYQDPDLRRKKLDRDVRILQLENSEVPNNPFTLFNLGSVYLELQQPLQAIPLLEKSLSLSHPTDSIVRKLYALLVQAHKSLSLNRAALAICEQGRRVYLNDAELQFQEGMLRRDMGDYAGAARCLEELLHSREEAHFASVDEGLRGYKARHNLAVLYRELQRQPEAIALWLQALEEVPHFHPARLGLAECLLQKNEWELFDLHVRFLATVPHLNTEVELLKAKKALQQKQFTEAKIQLEKLAAQEKTSLAALILLSHVYLQEGIDVIAAEKMLMEILRLDPDNQEARHNLGILNAQLGNAKSKPT